MRYLTVLTLIVMVAFAGNSILVRLALATDSIGPLAFGVIRLLAGATVLSLLAGPQRAWRDSSWLGAIYLLTYVMFFSYAYLSLNTGTGALILFATVQMVMIGAGIRAGERLSWLQWLGTSLAFCGLVFLLRPGAVASPEIAATPSISAAPSVSAAPSIAGAVMMTIAGLGWGLYSLKGKSVQLPVAATAGSFAKAALLALALSMPLLMLRQEEFPQTKGVLLALGSGAITSGLGYALWYKVLRFLPATRAGIAQLSVPAIAAIGGLVLLGEAVSIRLLVTTAMVLGGVGAATLTQTPDKEIPAGA